MKKDDFPPWYKDPIIIFIIVFHIILVGAALLKDCSIKEYKVEVTYLDSRPKKVIRIKNSYAPSNDDIKTFLQASPVFYGEVNVSAIKVVE